MGWKLQWQHRVAFLEKALRYETVDESANETKGAVVVCDGNALFRSNCVGTRPPSVMVRQVLAQMGVGDTCTRLIICFDNSNIPPARLAVHAERAKKATRFATETEINNVSVHSLAGTTWDHLFGNMAGKTAAFTVIVDALKSEIVRLFNSCVASKQPTFEVVISLPYSDEIWRYPNNKTSTISDPKTDYGEAEAQVVFVVEELVSQNAGPVVVVTIDTDIIIQLMGIYTRQVYIRLAKVWECRKKRKRDEEEEESGEHFRTLRLAKKAKSNEERIVPMYEYVSCAAVQRAFGPDALSIANTMFWMLLAAGVDYNNGLSRFGWLSPTVLQLRSRMVISDLCVRGVTLDLTRLCNELKNIKRRKPKTDLADDFIDELNATIYCFAYYLWYDQARTGIAGPRVRPLVAKAGGSLPAFLRRKHAPVTISNLHPHTKDPPTARIRGYTSFKRYIALGTNRYGSSTV